MKELFTKIKLSVVEDQELLRKSFIALLKEDRKLQVISEAANGKELLEQLKVVRPDVILLDIEMPVMNGKEALEIINKRFPDVKVIILTLHAGPNFVSELMARGARAFIPKDCDPDMLFEAIHSVHNEGFYFNKNISEAILRGLQREKSINPLLDSIALSDREIEILKELCEGKTNREIAGTLKIASSTVDYHRGNVYRKTGSKNVIDLIKYALKYGIISLT